MDLASLQGQLVGQFELRDLLGIGGMSAVYRAYHNSLEREVAIKIISPTLQAREQYLERFLREAKTAASLEHPHIVPVYDFGTAETLYYLVMRLLTGGSLEQQLQAAQRPIALSSTADLISQLSDALDYAHSRGVVHRDIKPSNILFDKQSKIYLADFGVAKLLNTNDSLTNTGEIIGTPPYMAPEQWRGEAVSPATDIYAIGVLTYLLLAGKLPYQADTPHQYMHKHLMGKPNFVEFGEGRFPKSLESCIQKALEKNPEDRYAKAGDFAVAFREAVSERSVAMIYPHHANQPEATRDLPPLASDSPTPMSSSQIRTPALSSLHIETPKTKNSAPANMGLIYASIFILALMLILLSYSSYFDSPFLNPSMTSTSTVILLPSATTTLSQTPHPSATGTASPTPRPSPSSTASSTQTSRPTNTSSATASQTPQPTATATIPPSRTLLPSVTSSPLPPAPIGITSMGGQLTGESVSHKFYWYEGDVLLTLQINSTEFDPKFVLLSPSGERLFVVDDCNGTRNACRELFSVPQTGEYTLIVQSYDGETGGNYSLTIDYLLACSHDTPIAIVIVPEANLRSGAGQSFPVEARVYEGDCLRILGRNERGTWLFVETEGQWQAWINATLIQSFSEGSTLPTAAP